MKRLAMLTGIAALSVASSAHAAGNGTINFTGAVNSQTCNATLNGENGASVTLPTVNASALGAPGSTAGQTAFSVNVTDCASTNPSGAGTLKAYFEKGANVDANGRLINTATPGATNVVLELVDGTSNTALKAGDISQNDGSFVAISGGNAIVPYSVRYYATGVATAGTVESSVTYSLIYN